MLRRKIAQARHTRQEKQSKKQQDTTLNKVTGFVSSSANTAKSLALMALGAATAEANHNGTHHHCNHSVTPTPAAPIPAVDISLSSTAANFSANASAIVVTGVDTAAKAESSSGVGIGLFCFAAAAAGGYFLYKTNAIKHCRDYINKRDYDRIANTDDEFDADLDQMEKTAEGKRTNTAATYQKSRRV